MRTQAAMNARGSRTQEVKAVEQHVFVRVLGKRPTVRTAKSSTVDQLGLFVETFGPPERAKRKNGSLLFWNFVRKDDAKGFSLVASIPRKAKLHPRRELEVRLSAGPGVTSFRSWTSDRLAGVESGEETRCFSVTEHS